MVKDIRGLVKVLSLLQGVRRSLFSEACKAASAVCHAWCILKYSQTNSRPLFPTSERRTVPAYYDLLPKINADPCDL